MERGDYTVPRGGTSSTCGREWRVRFLPLALLQHQMMQGLKILCGINIKNLVQVTYFCKHKKGKVVLAHTMKAYTAMQGEKSYSFTHF